MENTTSSSSRASRWTEEISKFNFTFSTPHASLLPPPRPHTLLQLLQNLSSTEDCVQHEELVVEEHIFIISLWETSARLFHVYVRLVRAVFEGENRKDDMKEEKILKWQQKTATLKKSFFFNLFARFTRRRCRCCRRDCGRREKVAF